MTPTITAVQGSNPSGQGTQIAADPRFGGGMSLHIAGTGLANVDLVAISGPNGSEGIMSPEIQDVTDTGLDIYCHIPIKGAYNAIAISSDGTVSNGGAWFSFAAI